MFKSAVRTLHPFALWTTFLGVLVFGLMLPFQSRAEQAVRGDPEALAYVERMSSKAYEILNHEGLDDTQKAAEFRTLVKASFDFRRIGMFALSRHRRLASREDVTAFLKVFEDYAINIYQSRLGEYSGERLLITGSTIRRESAKAREVIVHSQVAFSDGSKPWDVNWRLIARSGKYQVVDIQVIGIWMALEQRSQFSSIITREKGSVAALTEILQKRSGATADL